MSLKEIPRGWLVVTMLFMTVLMSLLLPTEIKTVTAVFTKHCRGYSGALWKLYGRTWATIYKEWGVENHWGLYVIGSWLVLFSVFCLTNVVFGALDNFGVPPFLQKYKIQRDKNVPMNFHKYFWTACVATFNMTAVTLANLVVTWHLAKKRMNFGYELPTPLEVTVHLLLCVLINEVGFYYLHRLMHIYPFLYKHVHKMHHDWKAPCSMATFYCHPLEHFFVNLGPFVLAPALVGTHLSVAWFYFVVGLISTTLGHCGYHFPLLPSAQSHDYHHLRSRDNYGTIGLLDRLHNSNTLFRRSPNFKKHFIFLSLTPVDKLIADQHS